MKVKDLIKKLIKIKNQNLEVGNYYEENSEGEACFVSIGKIEVSNKRWYDPQKQKYKYGDILELKEIDYFDELIKQNKKE